MFSRATAMRSNAAKYGGLTSSSVRRLLYLRRSEAGADGGSTDSHVSSGPSDIAVSLRQAVTSGVGGCFELRVCTELVKDALHVRTNSVHADRELRGNVAGGTSDREM